MAPAEKSGSAAMSCFGSGYGVLKNSSKYSRISGPILRAYSACSMAAGRAHTVTGPGQVRSGLVGSDQVSLGQVSGVNAVGKNNYLSDHK